MATKNISWGSIRRRPVHRADNPTNFMCRLPWNLGASVSWNPQGLSRDCFTFNFYLNYAVFVATRIDWDMYIHIRIYDVKYLDLCILFTIDSSTLLKWNIHVRVISDILGNYVANSDNFYRRFGTNCWPHIQESSLRKEAGKPSMRFI
jgi:hypothetical protein